jgi:hypothetical protein
MLEHWMLEPESTYLNHGTVGVTPRRVLQKQQALRDEMERHPSRFILRELAGSYPAPWRTVSRLREASDQIAAFVGSNGDDLVFVPNVTYGLNAVLASRPLGPGDEVVITDLAYGAITLTAKFTCEQRGATLRTVSIPWPVTDPGAITERVVAAITPQTKLVLIDHCTAQTALLLPVAEIARECHLRDVPVLVDVRVCTRRRTSQRLVSTGMRTFISGHMHRARMRILVGGKSGGPPREAQSRGAMGTVFEKSSNTPRPSIPPAAWLRQRVAAARTTRASAIRSLRGRPVRFSAGAGAHRRHAARLIGTR